MRSSWILLLGSATYTLAARLPTVDLGYAIHQGTINQTGQYFNFSNIRYGAAPTGNLRFAAPTPPQGRNRTVNDGQTSVICPQAGPAWYSIAAQFLAGVPVATLINESSSSSSSLSLSNLPKPDPRTSEDCLFLDVFVPEKIFNNQGYKMKKRHGGAPVMVWIYGGGFTSGSKTGSGNPAGLIARSQDDGQEGVIYVALNYRLGLFGWLSGPTFQENGLANAGLYDQRLALEWVQQNIHLFGGDPNRVTVFGESAGGSSIMHQITAFGGLSGRAPFQQAILQSAAFQPIVSNAQQETTFDTVLSYASTVTGKTISTFDQLQQLPSSVLQTVNTITVGLSPYGQFSFGPTVDGLIAPALPGVLLLHGQFDKNLKVMVGHNSNEGLFFASPFVQNQTAYAQSLQAVLPDISAKTLNYIDTVLYPPIFDGTHGYTSQTLRTSLTVDELSFSCNSRYLDLAFANQTYAYYFSVPPGLHGEDIAYTYFNGDTSTSDDGSPVNPTVAKALQDYLTSFAMNGNPNEKGVPYFPLYGSGSTVVDIAATNLGGTLKDPAANSRCDWWQKALYY